MLRVFLFIFLTPFFLFTKAQSADTIRVSINEADKIFLQNNLSLLAAKFNIDANKALIQQAKLWDNPVLNTDQNIYDGKFFQHNKNAGQVYIQVMQLIKTAGKRNKAAQLAADNTTISNEQFTDLLRTLRYTLHNDLMEVNHFLKMKNVYTLEIEKVKSLIKGQEAQLQLGNTSLKDNLRIKALLFSLQNEVINAQSQLLPIETELKLFLNDSSYYNSFITPNFNYAFANLTKLELPTFDSLLNNALSNRGDLQIAQTTLSYQKHNLIYQKAMAKPDVSIGVEYDRLNSYNPNYVGLAISLPINILNKNQGNIASAKSSIKQQQVVNDQIYQKVKMDITAAIEKINFLKSVNNQQQLVFSEQYDDLFKNVLKSYEDRQISLLDFIDFVDAYKDTKLKILEQHNNLLHAIEDLNYSVGSNIINWY